MTGSGTSRTPSPTGYSSHTGTSGRRPLQQLIAPIRRGAMPTHRPAGQMRILRRDTWVPPYRVRRSCRTGRRGRRPLQRFIVPIRRGRYPHRPRRANAHFAAGHMDPALQGTPVMQDGTSGTPSPTTVHRTRPQEAMPTAPRRQHKEAGASACLSVVRLFTWRFWRPRDRRGRPSDSAP